MRFIGILLLLALALPGQTSQTWDTSGNSQLSGRYYFREVIYVTGDFVGDLDRAIAVYGTINFDGNGGYSVAGSVFDSNDAAGIARSFSTTGKYSIAASGFGFLDNPVSVGDSVYGLVSNGIFIGSSTESGFQDLLVAAPALATPATEATLLGPYSVAAFDFPGSDVRLSRSSQFTFNADGAGNVSGTVTLSGYITGAGPTTVAQVADGVRYSFADGVATLAFPNRTLTNQTLMAGDKVLYVAAGGGFVFGGSARGWDMIVGVRTSGGGLSGLYCHAGREQDVSLIGSGSGGLTTYYGSYSAGSGRVIAHQRLNPALASSPYDYTYNGRYTTGTDGTTDDGTAQYTTGADGLVRISAGKYPYLGLTVSVRAPALAGPGVFLNPAGIVNAASSAPFTSGVAPGELITLYGTGLSPEIQVASAVPFPTTMAGVQVLINDRLAPIYVVAPAQVSVLVPYATEYPIAKIQVVNNGVASNSVTTFLNVTAPGTFTLPPGGIGYAAALHADYSLVTTDNPAKVGETIAVFVTGLGTVAGGIADGAAAPNDATRVVTNRLSAVVDGRPALLTYAGLAPGLAGLYQVNVRVPTGIRAGEVFLDLAGPDSYSSGGVIPIAEGIGTVGSTAGTKIRNHLAARPALPPAATRRHVRSF